MSRIPAVRENHIMKRGHNNWPITCRRSSATRAAETGPSETCFDSLSPTLTTALMLSNRTRSFRVGESHRFAKRQLRHCGQLLPRVYAISPRRNVPASRKCPVASVRTIGCNSGL